MPSAQRARLALAALFAVLLVPVVTSSLRGLTHVLTCDEETDLEYTVQVDDEGFASILSAAVLEAGAEPPTVCDGLVVDVAAGSSEPNRALLDITIDNTSEHDWEGTLELLLDDERLPVDVGTIPAGKAVRDTAELELEAGRTYQLTGNLLVGP